ncbi:hypothetical protein [Aquimarina megaterium]|uniref:hypothetical protein n=1 Tax=Aquimarina megaterium TaxID=1443666 RepID=UPI0009432F69|nr:hypothetical protein [Aquimarina megaterium]
MKTPSFWRSLGFIVGMIILLVSSVYLFTRPAIFSSFVLLEKGEIGDTIGGITAPITNIIGAVLVYWSFKAQIDANKKQFDILKSEINESNKDRNYELVINLFKDLKEDYHRISTNEGSRTGSSALYFFIERHKQVAGSDPVFKKDSLYEHKNIRYGWEFILHRYILLCEFVIYSEIRDVEKLQILRLVLKFHETQLDVFSSYIRDRKFRKEEEENYDLSKHVDLVHKIDEYNNKIEMSLNVEVFRQIFPEKKEDIIV